MSTKVRILTETAEGVHSATAFDEVGKIAQRNSTKDKHTAIRRVKEAVEQQIEGPIEYIEEDMNSGEEKEKRGRGSKGSTP